MAPWLVSFPISATTGLAEGSPSLRYSTWGNFDDHLGFTFRIRLASNRAAARRTTTLELLRAHYAAPGRAATATALAELLGFKGSNGINVSYGTLAMQIGVLIGDERPNISLLFEVTRSTTGRSGEWTLVMRPEFADGLKRARWIEEMSDATVHCMACVLIVDDKPAIRVLLA
jgi:hypothetical protein